MTKIDLNRHATARRVTLAIVALLPLVACDTPPPAIASAAAWHRALTDCRRYARLSGTGNNNWRDYDDLVIPQWELLDPCMEARGYPAPPP